MVKDPDQTSSAEAFRTAAAHSVEKGAIAFQACYNAHQSPVELSKVERARHVEAVLNPSGDREVAAIKLAKRNMGFEC